MIYIRSTNNPKYTHTVQEFVAVGGQTKDHLGYDNYSYIEKRDRIEYVVKNVIDDYYDELMSLVKEIKIADWVVRDYRGNPKKLSNLLYGTTRYWHMILRINGMCNIHEFNLENHKIKLIEPKDLQNFMTKVYNCESIPMKMYQSAHELDTTPVIIEKYTYIKDPSRKFNFY